MNSRFIYWMLISLLSLCVTILAQILFREYRFSHLSNLDHVGKIEFLFTAFFLPAYLVTLYFWLNKRFKLVGHFTAYVLLTIVCIIISSRIDFVNWWDTEGKIISVNDAETRDVIQIGLALQFIIALIFDFIFLFVGRSLSKTSEVNPI